MGCSSCAIFEAFSTALESIAITRLGASCVLHILDDFLYLWIDKFNELFVFVNVDK